ncbi:hypothetical protein BpJC7_06130 [Weizmannia acidilactici]|uniref:Helicase Helix-turn-helix domain-containing protein n=1 Tax=Weizmannia acidilactici TaxID=2607726 RepID=A0A5J4JFS4_9BACI|nr:helix-turn-helix domain-containing protein [Weizmannia acidilactici]GER66055.1 hypothetical protein BpJC4_05260 [Weizmannia acidilactici]GER69310.1 hypothetical protein BpJC7_06130 [Weizmannia acidilactici]GER72364.1 hypothetical protein BpPP18_04310 [Weizmannia acidilactici]
MSFLQAVLLHCFTNLNGERTPYAIFHLLNGKKSAQTIQDAHFFRIGELFQTYPFISRERFAREVHSMISGGLLRQSGRDACIVTEKGAALLLEIGNMGLKFPYLNGLKYQETANMFWKRLNLATQVVSNLIYEKKAYYPVQRDPALQAWLKHWLKQHARHRAGLAENMYEEYARLLSDHPPEKPDIFVLRLTGAGHIGRTIGQAAARLELDPAEYWYRFLHLLHFMVRRVAETPETFPLFYTMICDVHQKMPLTKSASKTFELLKKGKSIAEIAGLRGLRQSTIEDHLIEIALNDPDFPLNRYVAKEDENKILNAAVELNTKKLKPIKEKIGDVPYFQIRLVLAGRMGRNGSEQHP